MEFITPTAIVLGMLNFYAEFDNKVNSIDPNELKCLADNIYFEARNQVGKGQQAVAHVTLNRVRSRNFPNTICNVVKQGPTYSSRPDLPIKNRCQFSWYCDGLSDKVHLYYLRGKWKGRFIGKNFNSYTMAVAESLSAIIGWSRDPTSGATYYYAHNLVYPRWARRFQLHAKIQDHTFMGPRQ